MGVTSQLELLRRVVLPAALPSILIGVRQSLGQAWMAVVAAGQARRFPGLPDLDPNRFMGGLDPHRLKVTGQTQADDCPC